MESQRDSKAVLKSPQSRRSASSGDSQIARSVWSAPALAALSDGWELERWMIPVRTKSGAEVTAVQTLREFWRLTNCAKRLECAVFSGAVGWGRGWNGGCIMCWQKAVLKSPQSRRSANSGDSRIARSVWSAPASAALSGGGEAGMVDASRAGKKRC
jgi:hypothetical protein